MFYIVPAETTFADVLAAKDFDHRGKVRTATAAIALADALQAEEGREYAVLEIRRFYTTERLSEAALDEESERNADQQYEDPAF